VCLCASVSADWNRIEAISRDVRVMAVGELSPCDSHSCVFLFAVCLLMVVGGGSEEIMAELAIREEVKDLKLYAKEASKL
jgi:hypothetical protein